MARTQSNESSLELLLDTITNTFGSVLFLTILVTLLLRTTGTGDADRDSGTPPMRAAEQAMLESRISDAAREVDRLQTRLAAFTPADPALTALQTTIGTRMSDATRVLAEVATADGRTLDEQRLAYAADAERQRIDAALAEVEPQAEKQAERRQQAEKEAAQLAKNAVELDRPVDSAKIVQSAVLPVLEASDKKQFGIYLRYGRLYVMHRWDDAGERIGPNPNDFLIVPRPDGTQTATARPDAGCIADAATVHRDLTRILRPFPSDQWVVGVVVHDDSFSQFQAVKSALVSLGYQYEPIRTGAGDAVRDRGGSSRGQ